MAFYVCDVCGRQSGKTMADLKRDYGWTFHIVFNQQIARCGKCQKTHDHTAIERQPEPRCP